tara:strand:+ start:67 stop:393 length:327 start_codon:yes stop_codon:yes gene_type:complete
MVNIYNTVVEDPFVSPEDLADYAGDIAMQIYKNELKNGNKPSLAVSKAIEGANNILLEAGCPEKVCELLASAAIKGFSDYMIKNPNCDPMEAFDAAGEQVNRTLEFEF